MTNTNKQTYTFRHQHDVTGEIIELKAKGTNRGNAYFSLMQMMEYAPEFNSDCLARNYTLLKDVVTTIEAVA